MIQMRTKIMNNPEYMFQLEPLIQNPELHIFYSDSAVRFNEIESFPGELIETSYQFRKLNNEVDIVIILY